MLPYLLRQCFNRSIFYRVRLVLDSAHGCVFDGSAGKVFECVKHLHTLSDKDLTVEEVRASLHGQYSDTVLQHVNDLLDKVAEQPESTEAVAMESAINYATKQLHRRAAQYIFNASDTDNYDLMKPLEIMQAANGLRGLGEDRPMFIGEIDMNEIRTGTRTLGLGKELDLALKGGIANGEILILAAPPKRGKTSLLAHIGYAMAASGSNVLHVTLEIGMKKVAQRYYDRAAKVTQPMFMFKNGSTMTGVDVGPGTFINMGDFPTAVPVPSDPWQSRVQIKAYPPQRCGVEDIRSHIKLEREHGFKVDALIVDYAALLRVSKQKERRFEYGQLIQELRALAIEENLKCVTAWQINREGAREDDIKDVHLSEAWEVGMHTDMLIGINQTPDERTQKLVRLQVIYQRESTARPTILLKADWDTMDITPLNDT